jgi:small-conductance mechanosensitive channel
MEHAIALAYKTLTHMFDSFCLLTPNLIIGITLFLVVIGSARFIRELVVRTAERAQLDATLAMALGSMTTFGIAIIALLVACTVILPNFSPANLIAGLGITSVAIGFAFQDILRNFLAGLLLLWQKPFRIGDEIKTGNYEGTVKYIAIRTTEILTHSGEVVLVPNGNIFTEPIVVYTARDKRRAQLTLKLKNDNLDLERARKLIQSVIERTKGIEKSPHPEIVVGNIEPDSTTMDLYFWTASNYLSILQTTNELSSSLRANLKAIGHSAEVKGEQNITEQRAA